MRTGARCSEYGALGKLRETKKSTIEIKNEEIPNGHEQR
jgi:hypothetical protein